MINKIFTWQALLPYWGYPSLCQTTHCTNAMIGRSSSLHFHISSPMRNQKMNVAYMFYLVFRPMTPPKKVHKRRSSQYLPWCHEKVYKWWLLVFIHIHIDKLKLLDIVAFIWICRPFFRLIKKLYCNSLSPISNNKVLEIFHRWCWLGSLLWPYYTH